MARTPMSAMERSPTPAHRSKCSGTARATSSFPPDNNREPLEMHHVAHQLKLALTLGFCVGAATLAGAADNAGAANDNVLRATLDNGLKVIIVRNTLAPVAATQVNYLVGSDETPAGFPGTAHAQEHMMFRGSAGLSADQLADIGSIMGGNFNANTSVSLTQYLFTVPSTDLDIVLHIEALRMADVTDSKEEWDQERGAIEQEVAEDASDPQRVMDARLRAAMFADTPYEHDAL